MKLMPDDLANLASGAAFLATGGGGDPYLNYLTALQAMKIHGGANLVSINDLPDDAAIVAIGAVGAPTTSLELLPSVDDAANALEAYRTLTDRPVDAVISFEIGGGNSLVPIIAAAASGLPVIDGDGMGRALPEVQMMTYAIAGISATPSVGIDYAGNTQVFHAESIEDYEPMIRNFAMDHGGMILSVEFWMTATELRKCIVPDTVSLSIALGKVLRAGSGNALQVAPALAEVFAPSAYGEMKLLFSGTVADYSSSVVGGYDVGQAIISPAEGDGPDLKIDVKNEYLTAWLGDKLLASVPDLITILDFETAQPINAERLRFGQRIAVFGIGCPDHYRTPEALKWVAPKCFGFDFDYTPIEDL